MPVRPLSARHWSYGLTETLHAMGAPGVWPTWVEPLPPNTLREALGQAASDPSIGATGAPDLWLEMLEAEAGIRGGHWGKLGIGGGFQRSDVTLTPERGGYLDLLAEIPLSRSVALWGDGGSFAEGHEWKLDTGGLAAQFGAGQLLVGRLRPRIGQGTSRILLAGRMPMDGVLLGTARPFLLPGFLRALGRTTGFVFVAPNISTPTVARAWFTSLGLAIEPHRSVRLGLYRTIRFAGEGLEPASFGRVLEMLTWQTGDSDFDDNQGELSLRVRFALFGQPLATYLSLGFEDVPSLWEDPGLVAGVLLPLRVGRSILSGRYEYQAFGREARWCGPCGYKAHRWYTQREYGDYVIESVPLGSSLGGYGSRHQLEVAYWGGGLPLRLTGVVFFENREELNLLFDRWPGRRQGAGLSVAWRPRPGWELALGSVVASSEGRAEGPGSRTEGGLELSIRLFDLFGNPAGRGAR